MATKTITMPGEKEIIDRLKSLPLASNAKRYIAKALADAQLEARGVVTRVYESLNDYGKDVAFTLANATLLFDKAIVEAIIDDKGVKKDALDFIEKLAKR